jgi:hypothetical protein
VQMVVTFCDRMAYRKGDAVCEISWDDTVFCKTFAILRKPVLPTRTHKKRLK